MQVPSAGSSRVASVEKRQGLPGGGHSGLQQTHCRAQLKPAATIAGASREAYLRKDKNARQAEEERKGV